LGLVTAGEIADIGTRIKTLGECAVKCLDMGALIETADQAKPLESFPMFSGAATDKNLVKICVASDEAFSFRNEDNHGALRERGAEINFFSPLRDEELPHGADGLIFWGGYPELYAQALEKNTGMKKRIVAAADSGMPIYAECGGFLYLREHLTDINGDRRSMLGLIKGDAVMTGKLRNFGYYTIKAERDTLLCKAGESANAHFFHYSACDKEGDGFTAEKPSGKSFKCIFSEGSIFAGYQHLHFFGCPGFAENFIKACVNYRNGRERGK